MRVIKTMVVVALFAVVGIAGLLVRTGSLLLGQFPVCPGFENEMREVANDRRV